MKKSICIILAVILAFSCLFTATASYDSSTLKFGDDGKFKIMMFNDTQDTCDMNYRTADFLRKALESEKPDLAVIAGDMLSDVFAAPTKKRVANALRLLSSFFEEAQVPFTVTFGNHDHDLENVLSTNEMIEIFKESDYFCHSEGCDPGTFNLPVLSSDSSRIALNIYMMDTHNKNAERGGYDGVHPEQVEWYKQTSNSLKALNGGEAVPSLVFQHIPVKEIHQFYIEGEKGGKDSFYSLTETGWYKLDSSLLISSAEETYSYEPPCSEPTEVTTGQYEAWLEQGDIIGAFFGHDHINNFVGRTKDGIVLGYNGGSGFASYGVGDKRAARVFEIDENDVANYSTRSVFYGDITGNNMAFYPSDPFSPLIITLILRAFYSVFAIFK